MYLYQRRWFPVQAEMTAHKNARTSTSAWKKLKLWHYMSEVGRCHYVYNYCTACEQMHNVSCIWVNYQYLIISIRILNIASGFFIRKSCWLKHIIIMATAFKLNWLEPSCSDKYSLITNVGDWGFDSFSSVALNDLDLHSRSHIS